MKNKEFFLSFSLMLFACYLSPCYAQQSTKEIGDYSIEINFSSNAYRFKDIPVKPKPSNPLFRLFAGDPKVYGSNGFGFAFSKALNNKARIGISPSFYNFHNQPDYSFYESVGSSNSMEQQTYNMSGFSIPVSYISYFKMPKRKVSLYFIGGIQYYNYKLSTFTSNFRDSVLTSKQENKYNAKGIGINGGIGIDYKIKKWIYLFYGFEGGLSFIDASFYGDVRIGAGFNFIKKR